MEVESDVSDDVVGCFWNALNWAPGVTERPSVAQNRAQVTKPIATKNPPEKFHLRQNPYSRRSPAVSGFFLNAHPTSWPLDCICLYVQVKTYAYESRGLNHRPLIRRCALMPIGLLAHCLGWFWIDC
jgi:hypothetical protein